MRSTAPAATTTPRPPEPTFDAVIVGAGVAGLLAARTIAASPPPAGRARPRRVLVLDPRPPGGRARCDEREGFVLNRGPRALYVGGAAARRLDALGASLPGGRPSLGRAMAVADGTLHRLPTGAAGFARTTLLTPRQRVATMRLLTAALALGPSDADVSVAAWLDQRGATGRPRQLIEALVRLATYVDDPASLAAGSAFANVRRASVRGVRYLDGGFQAVVDALAPPPGSGIEVRRAEALAVESCSDELVRVRDADGTVHVAAAAIVAVGTPERAAALLGSEVPSSGGAPVPAAASCLELGLRSAPRHRFVLGIDEPTYLSVHAPPAQLAPNGGAVVHVVRYGMPPADRSTDGMRAELWALAQMAGVDARDVVVERYLPRMAVTGAIPRPAGDRSAGRAPVQLAERPNVLLAGDWVGPEGLLLDASCASASEAARLAAARADTMVGR